MTDFDTAHQIIRCSLRQRQQPPDIHAPIYAGDKKFFGFALHQQVEPFFQTTGPTGQNYNGVRLFIIFECRYWYLGDKIQQADGNNGTHD